MAQHRKRKVCTELVVASRCFPALTPRDSDKVACVVSLILPREGTREFLNFNFNTVIKTRVCDSVNLLKTNMFDNVENGNVTLESKYYIKYLGWLIKTLLGNNYHIDAISAKISKTVGLISKLRHSIFRHILLYIYQKVIHPFLNYGLAAWGQASKTFLIKILILQKEVLRMMYFMDIREHAIPLFIDADILPVTFMYYKAVASLLV